MTVTSGQLTVTVGMNSNETSNDRRRFIVAAYHGRLEEIIHLSSRFSCDVKVLSEALIRSCRRGHLDVVKWLKRYTAADVNYINSENLWLYIPLTASCSSDHLDIVKYLQETCHAGVNLSDREGYTSLTRACDNVSMSASTFLLCEVSDFDVNIATINGNTAMHLAVWCSKDYYSHLRKACIVGIMNEVLKLVYVRGQKINIQNNAGYTPLHLVCLYSHIDIVETLMSAGADETITNDRRGTPAQMVSWKRTKLLKLLNSHSLC